MADKISKEKRSENMRAIRSVSMLENLVTRAVWAKGLRFRKNVKGMPGKPDIVIKKYKTVIFIDSCFWHNCPIHGTIPKSNTEFWIEKLMKNKQRDINISNYYTGEGWSILRVWEHEIRSDFNTAIEKITDFINLAKSKESFL
ncbi:very short patch repair endonuclease [Paenibacillus sp. NPDC058367]|uniref:Very short patch repair endonuclease n=1 Tax=Paenibacillus etheri TaxID=1306852 RepID=A0A0W1API5_9BACL|nr:MULTISPECIES: very short patch repair endonuclease [Paenibacillus]KTD83155.1 very short patch repair endonuclease [Paenibacillus etheri]